MNLSDTEIIRGILEQSGYKQAQESSESDIVFLNTCAIRQNAENQIWKRLEELRAQKQKGISNQIVGVLGCMAERLKQNLIEQNKAVDLVVGPDAYRDLPRILDSLRDNQQQDNQRNNSINVQLSMDQTYADITPIRTNKSEQIAYISIMRGCNNMCSFCIVPFTRGRQRNRPISSIIDEVKLIRDQGYSEILLLGQNVNSYHDSSEESIQSKHQNASGFRQLYKLRSGSGPRFAQLLQQIAIEAPEVRIRFTSPHPQDFPDPVLDAINAFPNIAKNIHLPAQSGNSKVLQRMRRYYTREAYLELVSHIQSQIQGVTLSSDFIVGFCGQTEQEFQDTLSLMNQVKFQQAYMYAYSMRGKTHAHRQMIDDVDPQVQNRRLQELVACFQKKPIGNNEDLDWKLPSSTCLGRHQIRRTIERQNRYQQEGYIQYKELQKLRCQSPKQPEDQFIVGNDETWRFYTKQSRKCFQKVFILQTDLKEYNQIVLSTNQWKTFSFS